MTGFSAMTLLAMVAVLIGVPLGLARLEPDSRWGPIGCSTIITPFLMLGSIKLIAKIYWAMYPGTGHGCSGGECGGTAYAAGFWPLLIPVFMVPAFVFSLIVVLVSRINR